MDVHEILSFLKDVLKASRMDAADPLLTSSTTSAFYVVQHHRNKPQFTCEFIYYLSQVWHCFDGQDESRARPKFDLTTQAHDDVAPTAFKKINGCSQTNLD